MDSKVINKLIRSEIWPILRQQGFTVFETRNAYAYVGSFINVVNFQSFNSYLADGLHCTTYSFTVRLSTYLIGYPGGERIRHNNAGLMMPYEYECPLRTALIKRTAVDGFDRSDIFYIDQDGRTTAACFEEVKSLLQDYATSWFKAQNHLDGLLFKIFRAEHSAGPEQSGLSANPGSTRWSELRSPEEVSFCRSLDYFSNPGSYNWNLMRSVLLLIKLKGDPSEPNALDALNSIDGLVGTVLDLSTIQRFRPGEEQYALDFRELWDQLGRFQPVPVFNGQSKNRSACLDGEVWSSLPEVPIKPASSRVAARTQLWPILKNRGFSEFTDRLAHRVSKDLIEVVEFLPIDSSERKTRKLPDNLFRIGVGILWPSLADLSLVRRDRNQELRPIVNECHISNWLAPETPTGKFARMTFLTAEDAISAISGQGMAWFEMLRDDNSALSLLKRSDWELFWSFPMMRSYGASSSSRRHTYIANLHGLLGNKAECEDHFRRAEEAIPTWYNDHYGNGVKKWLNKIKPSVLRFS
jgi:hypothetical protein